MKICPSDIPDAILYRNIQSAKPVNSSWKKEEVPLSCLPEVLDDQATDNVLFEKLVIDNHDHSGEERVRKVIIMMIIL